MEANSVAAGIIRRGYPADAEARSYPYHVDARDTASLIRASLARAFPDVRFWVKTRRYSGGSSVDVYFDGGCCPPTLLGDVNALLAPFHGNGFDGMTDSSYTLYSWLRPDGTVTFAGNDAHYGGERKEVPAPAPDAVKVVFPQFVFVNNHRPFGS